MISKHVSAHLADPALMTLNDFEAFFAARKRALLDEIGTAIGKTIEDSESTLRDESRTLKADDDTDDL